MGGHKRQHNNDDHFDDDEQYQGGIPAYPENEDKSSGSFATNEGDEEGNYDNPPPFSEAQNEHFYNFLDNRAFHPVASPKQRPMFVANIASPNRELEKALAQKDKQLADMQNQLS